MLREIGLWFDKATAKWPPFSWLVHGLIALPFVGLVLWYAFLAPVAVIGFIEGERIWFQYLTRVGWQWVDVAIDAGVVLFLALAAWHPWTGPGAMFALREIRQMRWRYLDGKKLLWLDHIMDVLVPGCVGWLLLRP